MPASGIAPLVTPFGENTSLGVVKESVFGVFPGAPSVFHAIESWSATPSWKLVPRTGARKRRGQSLPLRGGYVGAASLTVEDNPDTIGQLLAYAMGAQTTPVSAITVNTTTTTSTAIGSTIVFTPASIANIFPGTVIAADTAGQAESLTVIAVNYSAGTFTANATKTHAIGVSLISTATTAKQSTLTFGQLPSFSTEVNYVTDAMDYMGCKIEGFSLKFDKNAGLTPTFNIVYANSIIQAAPTAPSYSTKVPFVFENPNHFVSAFGSLVGLAGQATFHSFDLNVANNLVKDYYSAGSGPAVVDFPETQRKVSGKVQMGFETDTARLKFLGSTTTPNINPAGTSFKFQLYTSDNIEATNVNYGIDLTLANVQITGYGTPISANGILYQDVSFEAAESANGASDDLSIRLQNTASAIY